MAGLPRLPPVVWKSDFYGTPEAIALLEPWVTTFVADFKFGNDACGQRVAGVRRYVDVVTRNLLATADRLIVRHLLLPGHFDCCYLPIVDWLAQNLPSVRFSLRDGFLPPWQARRLHGADANAFAGRGCPGSTAGSRSRAESNRVR